MKKIIAILSATVLALACVAVVNAEDKFMNKADKWITKGAVNGVGASVVSENSDDIELGKLGAETDIPLQQLLAHLAAQYSKYELVGGFSIISDDKDIDPVKIALSSGNFKSGKTYLLCHLNAGTGEWDATSANFDSSRTGIIYFNTAKSGSFALLEAKGTTEPVQPTINETNQVVENKQPVQNNNQPVEKKKNTSAPKTGEI